MRHIFCIFILMLAVNTPLRVHAQVSDVGKNYFGTTLDSIHYSFDTHDAQAANINHVGDKVYENDTYGYTLLYGRRVFNEYHAFEVSYSSASPTKERFSENPNPEEDDNADVALRSSISYTAIGFAYRYFVPLNDEQTLLFYVRPGFNSWSMESTIDTYSTNSGYRTDELDITTEDSDIALSGNVFDLQIGVNARVGDKFSMGWGVFSNSETSGININFLTNF